jgi:hypothetical protein
MKNYIGRKCKGFRFEDGVDGIIWEERMKECMGEIGGITLQYTNRVIIQFEYTCWEYPISLIEEHLIPETPEIPQLGEGVAMEVSNDDVEWNKRKVIAQMINGLYITAGGALWNYARPIPEVKKYTKEELVKILGHDFEIV